MSDERPASTEEAAEIVQNDPALNVATDRHDDADDDNDDDQDADTDSD